nr:unnamed protein product [Callosobruchus chinensis]
MINQFHQLLIASGSLFHTLVT